MATSCGIDSHIEGLLLCRFRQDGTPRFLSGETKLHLFRIAQEALSNAIRHADPEMIDITLGFQDRGLLLEVADDGIGVANSTSIQLVYGGLHAMRQRAGHLGGALILDRGELGGTIVRVRVPEKGESK